MTAIRMAFVTVGLTGLFACATPEPAPQPAPPPPPKVEAPPPPPPETADTCGAKPLQYLVGRPKSEIPIPVDPTKRRVACTACPVTQDYRPDRLNIFFDAETGIIKEVKCG
ncbi:MAG TPA: peptidase inhibitor I78 [Caulobacter sp.]|nr:peptidase inhibitor I78 [Caulobacter sp.]